MADNVELSDKILQFLMVEWARKDNRQLVSVELLYAPGGGFREEPIRKWMREDEPDFFAAFSNVEKLVGQIIEIAEEEANSKSAGKHRFVLRTYQHLGGRASMSFPLSPLCCGDETSVPNGGGGYGPQEGDAVHAQILVLTAENATLRRELEEARSNKLERELQLAMAMKMFEEVVNLIRPSDKSDGRPQDQPSPGRVNRARS